MDPSDFIKKELIPEMVQKGILSPSIKSVEISPISTDGTFMLTICRKVKVNLILPNSNEEEVHNLVVKVCWCLYLGLKPLNLNLIIVNSNN